MTTRGSCSAEAYQVINAQLLELQHHRAQVGPQDLWVGLLLQVPAKGGLGVQPEALPRLRAPGPTGSLMSACLCRSTPLSTALSAMLQPCGLS